MQNNQGLLADLLTGAKRLGRPEAIERLRQGNLLSNLLADAIETGQAAYEYDYPDTVKAWGGLLGGIAASVPQSVAGEINEAVQEAPGAVMGVNDGSQNTNLALGLIGASGGAGIIPSARAPQGALMTTNWNRGPRISQEMYDRLSSANSKKRKKWSSDGESQRTYDAIQAVRGERSKLRGPDPLEVKSGRRELDLNRRREWAEREAAATSAVSPEWNAKLAREVADDIRGGFNAAPSVNRANLEAVPRILKREGWSVRHASSGRGGRKSSRYLVSPDGKFEVRLSDHDLPQTGERQFNHQQFGTRWNDEVVLSGVERPEEIIQEIMEKYQAWGD